MDASYYLGIMYIKDLNVGKILVCQRQYQNILIYPVVYNISNSRTPLRFSFGKIYGYNENDGRVSYPPLISSR